MSLRKYQVEGVDPETPDFSCISSLTSRERQIILLVSQGLKSAEIGARLELSTRTVDNHIQRARDKTFCANRMSLSQLYVSYLSNQSVRERGQDAAPSGSVSNFGALATLSTTQPYLDSPHGLGPGCVRSTELEGEVKGAFERSDADQDPAWDRVANGNAHPSAPATSKVGRDSVSWVDVAKVSFLVVGGVSLLLGLFVVLARFLVHSLLFG